MTTLFIDQLHEAADKGFEVRFKKSGFGKIEVTVLNPDSDSKSRMVGEYIPESFKEIRFGIDRILANYLKEMVNQMPTL